MKPLTKSGNQASKQSLISKISFWAFDTAPGKVVTSQQTYSASQAGHAELDKNACDTRAYSKQQGFRFHSGRAGTW